MLFDVFQIQSFCTFCENVDSFRSKAPRFEKAGRVEVNPQLFETCVQVVEAGILWVGLNVLNKNAEAETRWKHKNMSMWKNNSDWLQCNFLL